MSELTDIKNYETYNQRMDKSMLDKLFFVDKIDTDLIVDFGCANGTLLKNIFKFCPDIARIGYDIDHTMVMEYSCKESPITSNWDSIIEYVNKSKNPTLILSSVIHEVFHYGSKLDITDFWNKVFNTGFKYIVIRDMMPSHSIDKPSCINDVKKIYHKFLGSKALTDFERIWGSIENNRQMVHFLLKYKYLTPNWEREVRENYLPLFREDLLAKIPIEYDVVFHEHYVLPYLLQTVKTEIGIEIKDNTHIKMILKKID